MAEMVPRYAENLVLEGMTDTRVVSLTGARQVGKTTLATGIATGPLGLERFTLDDEATRSAAQEDPAGFLTGASRPVMIDEVQRAPELLLAIKAMVDADDSPGQFLLTGSANLLASRRTADALTGRVDSVRLWPLAQFEIENSSANLVDALLAGSPPRISGAQVGRTAFTNRVISGGYPEARRRAGRRRERWFDNYVDSTLTRDLADISEAHRLAEMPGLLRLLAAQAANLLSMRSAAERLGLHHTTVAAYVELLEQIYLVRRLPGWRPGLGAREAARPKIYVVDTGLLCHLLGADERRLAEDDQLTGRALENFVAMEVLRHLDAAQRRARLYHYQRDKADVDLVLEGADGSLACIEVKASATVRAPRDVRWMSRLRDERSDRFRAGVVMHAGAQTIPLGDRLWALPISALWTDR